jgi:hypothetical protein
VRPMRRRLVRERVRRGADLMPRARTLPCPDYFAVCWLLWYRVAVLLVVRQTHLSCRELIRA